NGLTFALLWLDHARQLHGRGAIGGLRLIVPENTANVVAQLLSAVDSSIPISLWELDSVRETLRPIDPGSVMNLEIRLVPYRETEALLDHARPMLEPIVAQAPQAITLHPATDPHEVLLRFRGLPFARWHQGRIFLATPESREEINSPNQA